MRKFIILLSAVLILFPSGIVCAAGAAPAASHGSDGDAEVSATPSELRAAAPTVTIFPEKVIQGEPVKVVIEGVSGAAAVRPQTIEYNRMPTPSARPQMPMPTPSARKISFDGKPVAIFLYQGKQTAFIGIDFNKKPGEYKVVVTLTDGSKLEKTITVGKREKIEAPLGIPEKLGGNTPVVAKQMVSSLLLENQAIYSVRTFARSLWAEKFIFPIPNPIVTDPYGYLRQTIGYSLSHKGTDLRAEEGTPVVAMNRGIIRLARSYQIYGKTVIVDHGAGLMTLYMHLSKIKVNEGELVKQGQVIGLSGKTGYAESPHLHLSVWIDKVSVDPMKFMALFQ